MTNLQRAQAVLDDQTPVLFTDRTNVLWLTGFTGSYGHVLLSRDRGTFITDSRYAIQAAEQVKGLELITFAAPKRYADAFEEARRSIGSDTIGFESSVAYGTWTEWVEKFPDVSWVPTTDLVRTLRMIKTDDEVRRIKASCALADACLEHVSRMIQPGVREYDIGLDIEFFFRRNGASLGFDPIVASGPNSARPHASPSERTLETGDFVTLDLGARLDGYCSDITRTFVVGKASERQREVYDQVLKAELAGIRALVPGVTGATVDDAARVVLDEIGLAKYFGHGLGHGLGLDVHDPGSLNTQSTMGIEVGQVWTVEPGVYIEGWGGVRIEDDVLVTESGVEVLTKFPKSLTELS